MVLRPEKVVVRFYLQRCFCKRQDHYASREHLQGSQHQHLQSQTRKLCAYCYLPLLLLLLLIFAGGHVPVGGASSIAAAMIPIIEAAGGAVVTSAGVKQVLEKDGKAAGVRLESGQEITSDVVSCYKWLV